MIVISMLGLLLLGAPVDSHVQGWADLYNVGVVVTMHDSSGYHTWADSQFDGTYSWSDIGKQARSSSWNANARVGVHHAERQAGNYHYFSAGMWRYRASSSGRSHSPGDACNQPWGEADSPGGSTSFIMDTTYYSGQTAEKNWRMELPHSNVSYTGSGTKDWEYTVFTNGWIDNAYHMDSDTGCYAITWY